uniref:Uncharacterized protein n=1 Tax=Hyaloperonospora arabidopsidis (strain Emoy2) TaxID=559515 RepID=M4B2X3_HYAAE
MAYCLTSAQLPLDFRMVRLEEDLQKFMMERRRKELQYQSWLHFVYAEALLELSNRRTIIVSSTTRGEG